MYFKQISKSLCLEYRGRYTRHSFCRTSLMFAVERGLSTMEIKGLLGHRSDIVVQGYVEKGARMRDEILISVALAGNKRKHSESDGRAIPVQCSIVIFYSVLHCSGDDC